MYIYVNMYICHVCVCARMLVSQKFQRAPLSVDPRFSSTELQLRRCVEDLPVLQEPPGSPREKGHRIRSEIAFGMVTPVPLD